MFKTIMAGCLIFMGLLNWNCLSETKIQQVNVVGQELLRTQEIIAYLDLDNKDIDYSKIDLDALELKLKTHPRINSAKINKKETILHIEVDETEPALIVQINGRLHELDRNFNILSTDDVRLTRKSVLSGAFKINDNRVEGSNFYALWKQVDKMFSNFPSIEERVSEIELDRNGEIIAYVHHPVRAIVYLGNYISNKQTRRFYASLAYMEAEDVKARVLDLRGEDAVIY
ncbi:cell division protein FtsQ/DivIB [Leptospira sp. GIMC2001]|uniref:cell division protein FtsQ/DivIB n=1 Tax=Leptospira sp. GIMC2001 TaxID=1513297 RepID=UPI0023495E30|nr:FtsQ-type POTRA domain-containing protein [Leptospira sp. GIMC2001]WCL48890.1 FtsQ-type POTRA domain-containing protein [Leptospira sp. GIMC2001]